MKKLVRLVTVALLLGGWGLAAAAVQVVRTPYRSIPYVFTKEQLGFTDIYLDTRSWTVADVQAHPAMVQHLIRLNRAELLANTVPVPGNDVKTQLLVAMVGTTSAAPAPQPTVLDKAAVLEDKAVAAIKK